MFHASYLLQMSDQPAGKYASRPREVACSLIRKQRGGQLATYCSRRRAWRRVGVVERREPAVYRIPGARSLSQPGPRPPTVNPSDYLCPWPLIAGNISLIMVIAAGQT